MQKTASFSPCRRYRYELWRRWSAGGRYAMFVGLNPSTADETTDDPTIRRCTGFARAWGCDGLCMTNLFAYCATDPREMLAQADAVGIGNDDVLVERARAAALVMAAWGTHGTHQGRAEAVRRMLPGMQYLRLTRNGQPGHPLYLPATLRPMPWNPPGGVEGYRA